MTRVVLVTGEYPPQPGGIGDYTHLLRSALDASAADVQTLVVSSAGTDADVRVPGWTLRHARHLHTTLRDLAPDVVHIQYQAGAFALSPAILWEVWRLRQAGIPCVVTFHDLRVPYLFPKAGSLRKLAIVRAARSAAAVVVTNPADARRLRRDWLDVDVIPIGANLPALDLHPHDALPPHADPVVGFFGFPARSKGVLTLIEALGLLDAPRPPLRLIGEPGVPSASNDIVAADTLDAYAAQHGVVLERTGPLAAADAARALASVRLLCLPFAGGVTQRSGSLLAALQSGRPVVATAPARLGDLGSLALAPHLTLVDDDSAPTLANALRTVWQASPVHDTTTALPQRFTWPAIAEAHTLLYDRVLRERR